MAIARPPTTPETVPAVRKSSAGSFDFGEIEALQHAGRWDDATALMIEAAQRLERGGADFFLICTNTMHRMADQVQAAVQIPLLHIADPTAERIKARGIKRVGLLGTGLARPVPRERLGQSSPVFALTPSPGDRARPGQQSCSGMGGSATNRRGGVRPAPAAR